MDEAGSRCSVLYLLDVDPDLGEGIPAAEFEGAREHAIAQLLEVDGPHWNPGELPETTRSWLGLFVATGLLIRQTTVAGRASAELFGAGDILRPWEDVDPDAPVANAVDWLVLKPTRLAVLDEKFARRIACWPSISANILQRGTAHARQLVLAAAVTHIPRVRVRILLTFSLLAERWGTVTPEGISISLPLTHDLLGALVGSQRPTVSVALRKLADQDLLIRQSRDRWLLTNKAIQTLRRGVEGSSA
jgi:hypothetical protein